MNLNAQICQSECEICLWIIFIEKNKNPQSRPRVLFLLEANQFVIDCSLALSVLLMFMQRTCEFLKTGISSAGNVQPLCNDWRGKRPFSWRDDSGVLSDNDLLCAAMGRSISILWHHVTWPQLQRVEINRVLFCESRVECLYALKQVVKCLCCLLWTRQNEENSNYPTAWPQALHF